MKYAVLTSSLSYLEEWSTDCINLLYIGFMLSLHVGVLWSSPLSVLWQVYWFFWYLPFLFFFFVECTGTLVSTQLAQWWMGMRDYLSSIKVQSKCMRGKVALLVSPAGDGIWSAITIQSWKIAERSCSITTVCYTGYAFIQGWNWKREKRRPRTSQSEHSSGVSAPLHEPSHQ